MASRLLRSTLEMAGIVFLRFPPLIRAWAAGLVAVNAIALVFIQTVYGQVALAAVGAGVIIMVLIMQCYQIVLVMILMITQCQNLQQCSFWEVV